MQQAQPRLAGFQGLVSCRHMSLASVQPAATFCSAVLPARFAVEAKAKTRHEQRVTRHRRLRNKVEGTTERPRLAVFRSLNHIYAQVIDDSEGHTLASISSLTPDIRAELSHGGNVSAATLVGRKLAEVCIQRNIEKVAFDRGGFLYHGRVQALADAAREAGLKF
ncbi:PRPL18 [Auxenochlorella protothecoides x Auxenochlorella symbiontica]